MLGRLINIKRTHLILIVDLAFELATVYLTLFILGNFKIQSTLSTFNSQHLLVTAVSFLIFYIYEKINTRVWRSTSIQDISKLIKVVVLSSIMNFLVLNFLISSSLSISFYVLFPIQLTLALTGIRFIYQFINDYQKHPMSNSDRVLIIGAGAGGVQLAKEVMSNRELMTPVVGFVDDAVVKQGRVISGIPVLGKIEQLPRIIKTHKVTLLLLAIPSATNDEFKRILNIALQTEIPLKTLPKISDILTAKSRSMQLRDIRPEDLLGRDRIHLDTTNISAMIDNKRVLITGAGGSIGSEICRQVSQFNPELIVLYELSEFLLYEIEMELRLKYPTINIVTIVGDVKNREKLETVFVKYKLQMVIHAAAYKQVPLMERNPQEAIFTNVNGTKNVAELTRLYKVPRFVMISTDKAVNPTNVMGATKRIAEMVIHEEQNLTNDTIFTVVRFGNVLGSNGSVIPLFKKQIENGGPVTVTHPEITRYFMSIPEACQLVLQAASMSSLGQILVLDMGTPVKIIDLARQMITLSGFTPDVDIKIEFSGLREGEKLFEELLADKENTTESPHPSIRTASRRDNIQSFKNKLSDLTQINENTSPNEIHYLIKELVPEFTSSLK